IFSRTRRPVFPIHSGSGDSRFLDAIGDSASLQVGQRLFGANSGYQQLQWHDGWRNRRRNHAGSEIGPQKWRRMDGRLWGSKHSKFIPSWSIHIRALGQDTLDGRRQHGEALNPSVGLMGERKWSMSWQSIFISS